MESRDLLLHNEIQHLGQLIQTLSCELVVVQDFLKDHFGLKFAAYRRKYALIDEIGDFQKDVSGSKLVAKNPDSKGGCNSAGEISDIGNDDNEHLIDFEEDGINYHDPCSDSSDDNESENVKNTNSTSPSVPTANSTADRSRIGGRRRMKIWKFYDTTRTENNKLSARCHICRCRVSPKADRMVKHRIKCKMQGSFTQRYTNAKILKKKQHSKTIAEKPDIKQEMGTEPDHFDDPLTTNDACDANTIDTNTPTTPAGKSETGMINITSTTTSSHMPKIHRGGGRGLDEVWKYFEIVTVNGFRKAKCSTCGHHVSPKVDRMKSHKVVCGEVAR